jgi:hypothetical protein
MSNPESSLPAAWVERIWAVMRASYGAAFDRLWEVPAGVDPVQHVADLKAFWGRELCGYRQNPGAIAHALDHLPEYPPNLLQFKRMLLATPTMVPKALPSPKPDPERLAQAMAGLSAPSELELDEEMRRTPPMRRWAVRLKRRHQSGEKIPAAHVEMYRSALREPGEIVQ